MTISVRERGKKKHNLMIMFVISC